MKRNPLEWLVLGVSALAVTVLVGYLLFVGLTGSPQGVRLSATVGETSARSDGAAWLVPVTVTNDGEEAAIGVVVEASVDVGGEASASEITIDLLPPGGSSVEVVFAFDAQPEGPVTSRIVAYERP